MDPWLLRVFQMQVAKQCRFALIAFEELENDISHMENGQAEHRRHGLDHIWYSIQGLLVAAGNISKLLWPTNSRIADRGTALRASLNVRDDSPLQPRAFRNHFEHFDERLEEFFLSFPPGQHSFIDSNISPGGIGRLMGGAIPERVLRHYDQANKIVTFRGDKYELTPIIAVIRELLVKTEAELERR
jgi:hypothetical protein